MGLSQEKLIDLLERAEAAGCFSEVVKLVKSGTNIKLIETIISHAQKHLDDQGWFGLDFFNPDD